MADLAFVVDSTADLPESFDPRSTVRVVPLRILWGGESYQDRVEISTQDFYRRLRSESSLPTTSAPPPGDFEQTYEELLREHEGVVSIHLPSSLSGTYSAAVAAANHVNPGRIRVVEGGHCSLGLGWLAERAAKVGFETGDLNAAAAAATQMVSRVRLLAALDTLDFLQRGGRIGRVAALAGALLNVKPLLQISNGRVLPLERVRSRGAALRRLHELTLEMGRLERLAVLHGDALDGADSLYHMLSAGFPHLEIERGEISPVVGVHGGPGIVGVAAVVAES
ncbi:MAG TPA: DegV family protein [Chloroflexota bacterium]|nr:DegV family protein [Chloroflexota bacterium]